MSFLDVALLVLVGIAMIFGAWFGHAGLRAWLLRLPLALVVVAAATGGFNQRMVGVYGLAFLLLMSTVVRNANPRPLATGAITRAMAAVLCMALLAGALVLPSFLPAAALPATGR